MENKTVFGNIELGKEYVDSVLGFKGKATAYCVYLSYPDQVELSRLIDGKVEREWFNTEDLTEA